MRTVLALLALASVLEAQGDGGGLLFPRRISQNKLAAAISSCDRMVLRPSCPTLVKAAEKVVPANTFVPTNEGLSIFVQNLPVRSCPKHATVKASEWIPDSSLPEKGKIIFGTNWSCEPDEQFVWYGGKPFMSLYDGNLVESITFPSAVSLAGDVQLVAVDTPPRRSVSGIPISKGGAPLAPRLVEGPPGTPGAPGTDCAGLAPVSPPRTCPGLSGPPGAPGAPGMQGPPGTRARGFNPWPWLLAAAVGTGLAAWYCSEHNWCRGSNENNNTNINNNGMVPLVRLRFP